MATAINPGLERAAQRRRRRRLLNAALVVVLLIVGASMDASLIPPRWPLARHPEQVGATFARCNAGTHDNACVIDGDSIRLGERQVRMIGIAAPGIADAKCPAERALGERAANRLVAMLNQGPFQMVAHRFDTQDKAGRSLMVFRRGDRDIGRQLIDEGLVHRYLGFRRGWC